MQVKNELNLLLINQTEPEKYKHEKSKCTNGKDGEWLQIMIPFTVLSTPNTEDIWYYGDL